jgi:uncharacterized membrane protein
MSDDEDWRDRIVAVTTFLVLGVGFVAMFLEVSWFWMVWVLGFAVLVPMLAVLLGVDDEDEPQTEPAGSRSRNHDDAEYRGRDPSGADALETLRERYARGDLTDEQFERKLDRLLETETIEDVEDAHRRAKTGRTGARDGTAGVDDEPRTERER